MDNLKQLEKDIEKRRKNVFNAKFEVLNGGSWSYYVYLDGKEKAYTNVLRMIKELEN